ncbi:MAG: ribonuclease R [Pseudomonadota bacterium]|nr:ribonuclease R [Pseudomonadota bacterium]
MAKRQETEFPTKRQILEFIQKSQGSVGKREIARAFKIRGNDRTRLNDILRDLRASGDLARGRGRRFDNPGTLRKVAVIEITGLDKDGDPLARPANWDENAPPPTIYLQPNNTGVAPRIGDRVLARISPADDGTYSARTIKQLDSSTNNVLGVFKVVGESGRIIPTNRRIRSEFSVQAGSERGATPGDIVEAQTLGSRKYGLREARIVDVVASGSEPRAPSLIAIHTHGIPTKFSPRSIADAGAARSISLEGRTDLRGISLITIDGEDARDFDDAVWAEPDTDPRNIAGWHLVVAIADVAYYVKPDSPLDKDAYERGNSVYFPDQVVPMLPEALSSGMCSLLPGEDRGCLAVHMWIDASGILVRHEFLRGIMRSAARLTYEEVQRAKDNHPDEETTLPSHGIIENLYGAFEALKKARMQRGTMDFEIPERRIHIDQGGDVSGVDSIPRLDSHRLIEEFMINANVAAAETLEGRGAPCMFRIHDRPSLEKVESLRETLTSLGIKLARGQVIKPHVFQNILRKFKNTPQYYLVGTAVLRTQSQATYGPDNIGHFGLSLRRYAHFTSPIRRYSDLLVHRALIGALSLGNDGLQTQTGERFYEIAKHVSFTERRAVDAERDAADRFTAKYLANEVGAEFAGRINSVHRVGVFVTLEESRADGLVPMSLLGADRFEFNPRKQQIEGQATGKVYKMGNTIRVRLEEANTHTGSLAFSVVGQERNSRHGGEKPNRVKGNTHVTKHRRRRAKNRPKT